MTELKGSSKSSTKVRMRDFERMAIVNPDIRFDNYELYTDSEAITKISDASNQNYSKKIIDRVKKTFDLSKLEKYKNYKTPHRYYKEAKKQVKELHSCMEDLNAHTALFKVSIIIAIGKILDDVEEHFGKKAKYMKWIRANFGHRHLRYFQHAKQLAKMGDFARKYAPLGKNRLLNFARLETKLESDGGDLITKHPFPDITDDIDGVLFKEHVDAIITYYRMIETGIKWIVFEQAGLIAAMLHKSIAVKKAKDIKSWLDNFDNDDKKKQAISDYLLNKLVFPYPEKEEPTDPDTNPTLNRAIGKFLNFCDGVDLEDEHWVEANKGKIDSKSIVNVHHLLVNIAEKLEIDLSIPADPENDTEKNNEKSKENEND